MSELGAGGMGIVYLAHDPDLGRNIALKVVATAEARSEQHATRLQREAQALAQLSHPNVISVFEVGRVDGGVFLAMEFVEGHRLDEWLHDRPRTWREILRVFRDAGRGLAAAHAAGLIHRDFKPANLMVGSDGRVRVLDFGLARASSAACDPDASATASLIDDPLAGDDVPTSDGSHTADWAEPAAPREQAAATASGRLLDTPLTKAGMVVGTPPYMAPEQHLGRGADARSDQFSFCVTFYQALYGERPFGGASYQILVDNITRGKLKPQPAGSRVPGFIRQILLKGLAVAPADRYPSMDAILDALARDPAKRWRRAGAAVAVASLLGLAAFGVWRGARISCGGAEASWRGVWDPARREVVERAFASSGKPFAADAFASVARALDKLAHDWAHMRTDACEATRVRGEQSAELLDLRMECLGARLDEAKALVDVLASADGAVVERAPDAVRSLPPLAGCADAKALRARVPPPADRKTRARVDEIRAELARGRALWEAGRYADGLRIVTPAVAEARATNYRAVEAEALLALARLDESSGDYSAAARSYREAGIAAEAGRHDEIAALAENGLVWVVGERQGKYADAHELERDAEAKIERLGGSDLLRADLDSKVGALYLEEGKYDQALDYARRALTLREKALAADDPAVASALGDLADVELQRGHYHEAIDAYQRALALSEKALGPRHPKVGALHINLGGAYRAEGDNDRALAEYRRARAICEPSLGASHPTVATIYLDLGGVLQAQHEYDKANADYSRALAIWNQTLGAEHPNVATVRFRLGSLQLERGRPEEALADFRRALGIWEKALGAEHPSLSAALDGMGDAFLAEGKPAEALPLYRRSLAVLEKALGAKHPALADPLTGIGLAELAAKAPRRAIAPLERSLVSREVEPGDALELARTRFALARALSGGGGGRARARELARLARGAYAAARPVESSQLAAIDRFLSASPRR